MIVDYIEKKGTESLKWDYLWKDYGSEDLLPLCTSEMDFDMPECVRKALAEFVSGDSMGIYAVEDQYYENFIKWQQQSHQIKIKREWIRYSPSIEAAVSRVILMTTEPGQSVMVLSPESPALYEPVLLNGRRLITSDLVRNDNGKYLIDFRRVSKDIEENDVKLLLISAPHNPCGRVWTAFEMMNLMDICSAHGVPVVWDESLSDYQWCPGKYLPAVSLADYSQDIISISSPAVTFGLCGIQDVIVVIPNDEFRARFTDIQDRLGDSQGSALDFASLSAALECGRDWMTEAADIIRANYEYLNAAFSTIPGVVVSPIEGGYYMWADFASVCPTPSMLRGFFEDRCRLAPDRGADFGGDRFGCFVRINLATDISNIEEAASRILRVLGLEEG